MAVRASLLLEEMMSLANKILADWSPPVQPVWRSALQFPASLHRLLHRDLIGVLDIAADGNAGRDACHLHA